MYKAMTIAGSDSGGGAGIQADLKTFSALGVYGTSAITALTAQNTRGVWGIHEAPPEFVAAQIDAVLDDIGADAVKTGMLASAAIIEAVVDRLRAHRVSRLVVDPVMVAKGGDRLLRESAVESLRTLLLPIATVVTPNIPEAETIVGFSIATDDDVRRAARAIHELGAAAVVVKGGHRQGDAVDILFDGREYHEYRSARIATKHTHGTGCTFAAAVAAGLATGLGIRESVAEAKAYLTGAIAAAVPIGGGISPVHHFYRWWTKRAE
jgi:hydroxymethylpyrimidine/phosphomethylpyrimidine kinase